MHTADRAPTFVPRITCAADTPVTMLSAEQNTAATALLESVADWDKSVAMKLSYMVSAIQTIVETVILNATQTRSIVIAFIGNAGIGSNTIFHMPRSSLLALLCSALRWSDWASLPLVLG